MLSPTTTCLKVDRLRVNLTALHVNVTALLSKLTARHMQHTLQRPSRTGTRNYNLPPFYERDLPSQSPVDVSLDDLCILHSY